MQTKIVHDFENWVVAHALFSKEVIWLVTLFFGQFVQSDNLVSLLSLIVEGPTIPIPRYAEVGCFIPRRGKKFQRKCPSPGLVGSLSSRAGVMVP